MNRRSLDLIPELSGSLHGNPPTVDAWLTNVGRYDLAVAYASLFWPEFSEVDDCVLLGPGVPESYGEWRARYPDNPGSIEAVLNHRHILDLFLTTQEPSLELVRHLGTVLKEMWSAKLHRDFPDRQFVVSFPEEFDLEVDDPELTFYTKRD